MLKNDQKFVNCFSWDVFKILNDTDTVKELQLDLNPSLIGHYRIPYFHTPVLKMRVLQIYCTHAAHLFQLTSVHTGDEDLAQKAKCLLASKGMDPRVLCLILLN